MTIKKKPTTIRDIAKLADVSYQTVSLVINQKPGVSEATRKRIVKLMEELDFRPNHAAQMLTTHRSKTLELIIADVTYGGRLADSTKNMARTAKEAGYNLLISETDSSGLAASLDSAAARLVDGILLYGPRLRMPDDELLKLSHGIPMVRRDYVPGSKLAWVGFDQAFATRLLVEHLIQLGHRHIAAIPPQRDLITGYWRYNTWRSVLMEHGLEPGPYCEGDYSIRSGYEAAQQLVATRQPFTGIMVGTDYMALGVIAGLRECGLHVPDDVSIVSFDNAELATYIEPPLTTIDFKFAKQDEMAVKYLLEFIHNPTMERHQRILQADLIVRKSTRALT